MLDAIRRALGAAPDPAASAHTGPAVDPVSLAACTLLLEMAWADGEFAPEERRHIESALTRHFSLTPDQVADLMQAAEGERKSSVDHFQYTRTLTQNFDLGQKMVLAEILWGVILADGRIDEHEEYLVRKLANLLNLEPGYLSQARRSAGSSPPGPEPTSDS